MSGHVEGDRGASGNDQEGEDDIPQRVAGLGTLVELMQQRRGCRECSAYGHKRSYYWNSCDAHLLPPPDEQREKELALVEERLRDQFAGEAAEAALLMKKTEDERALARETAHLEEQQGITDRLRWAAEASRLMAPKSKKCADCYNNAYGKCATEVEYMCKRHSQEYFVELQTLSEPGSNSTCSCGMALEKRKISKGIRS